MKKEAPTKTGNDLLDQLNADIYNMESRDLTREEKVSLAEMKNAQSVLAKSMIPQTGTAKKTWH